MTTIVSQELCSCGRPFLPIHCVGCGRKAYYALSSKAYIVQTSTGPLRVMVYHCRGCGINFDDLMRSRCEAPKKSLSMKEQRRVDHVVDRVATNLSDLPEHERKARIAEIFKNVKRPEAEASVLLDRGDGETQVVEEKT